MTIRQKLEQTIFALGLLLCSITTASAEEQKLIDLKSGDELKAWFKHHDGKQRLILFLSPT